MEYCVIKRTNAQTNRTLLHSIEPRKESTMPLLLLLDLRAADKRSKKQNCGETATTMGAKTIIHFPFR